MESSSKTISVIIPVYNGSLYISEAIQSVLSQSMQLEVGLSIEVIVVDDGSTDNTVELVQFKFPQVRLLKQSRLGAAAARNYGITEATGELIAFLDADDIWKEGKLQCQLKALKESPSIDLIFGQVSEFEDGPNRVTLGELKPGLSPITLLCHKSKFEKIGLFNTEVTRGEFIEWYDRAIALKFKVLLVPEVVALRRIHQGNRGKLHQQGVEGYAQVAWQAILRRRKDTPVVLFVYNRPECLSQILQVLRDLRVSELFVIADGPRTHVLDDLTEVSKVRDLIGSIDWPCKVAILASEENKGIRRSYDDGLDWVFSQVEEAIILEDDCLPNPSFFRFCRELLEKYRQDESILQISGMSLGTKASNESYVFSKYPLCWGWATWKNRWKYYDSKMSQWNEDFDRKWLHSKLKGRQAIDYWDYIFTTNKSSQRHWDISWIYSAWMVGGKAIHPSVNLITNTGFNKRGTHAFDSRSVFSLIPAESMTFPLLHPSSQVMNESWDDEVEFKLFSGSMKKLFAGVRDKLQAAERL